MKNALTILSLLFFSASVEASVLDRRMHSLVSDMAVQYKKANPNMVSKAAVAVITFQNKGRAAKRNYIGEAVSSVARVAVQNSLVFYPVERENLAAVTKEIELSMTGLLDEKSQTKFTGVAGVDCLILGEVTESAENFVITCQLVDATTAKILATAKTEIERSELIRDTEKYAYEFITANGIGITFSQLIPVKDWPDYRYNISGEKATTGLSGRLTYRFLKNLKVAIVYNGFELDPLDTSGREARFGSAKNMKNLNEVSNYHPWTESHVNTNLKAGIGMQPDYTLMPEVTTFALIPSYVFTFSKTFSLSVGAGPSYSMIKYNQHCANVPHLVEGAVEYRDLDIINEATSWGVTGTVELEYFIFPRLALNLGCVYSYMLSLTHNNKAIVNGVTYYRNESDTPDSLLDGYGYLINDYFGYDPFKTFNGRDVYVKFHTFHLTMGVSFYF
ncbi:MAG: CsgG/HfaB family protein [bacterium]|nr:CsgG/HfaB family protein [bacterium]